MGKYSELAKYAKDVYDSVQGEDGTFELEEPKPKKVKIKTHSARELRDKRRRDPVRQRLVKGLKRDLCD